MHEDMTYRGFGPERLDEILAGIRQVKVALVGDFALDVYWRIDMTRSELSRETPHYTMPVVEERMSPGAAGNVAANIMALSPCSLSAFGVIGADWRGQCLRNELEKHGVDTRFLLADSKRMTTAYCKPIQKGLSAIEAEAARIDFDPDATPDNDLEDQLIALLDHAAASCDILCVSDQIRFGCVTDRVREAVMRLAGRGLRVVVDSRDRIGAFRGVIIKPNDIECLRAVLPGAMFTGGGLEERIQAAEKLAEMSGSKVCMTVGPAGCVICSPTRPPVRVPAPDIKPPLDIVGAGDSFLSAFACALAAGAQDDEAAFFANLASGVTIQKIGTTGTASPDEIRRLLK